MKTKTLALALALGCCMLPARANAQADSSKKKSDNTGAQTTIKPQEGDLTLMDILRRKAPGLEVFKNNDGTYEVHIRGAAQDASGATPPLLILDGMPANDINAVFNTLDPNTIDKVTVLRDVASTAMYGTRGAGGVILITTKRH